MILRVKNDAAFTTEVSKFHLVDEGMGEQVFSCWPIERVDLEAVPEEVLAIFGDVWGHLRGGSGVCYYFHYLCHILAVFAPGRSSS